MRCSPNLTRTLFSVGLGLVLLAGCARATGAASAFHSPAPLVESVMQTGPAFHYRVERASDPAATST
ncbi:MAG TPA: hypothetical protein VE201_07995, partial [Nitrospirales bacterium]|nr:hypothetical protein [Nitrospirales bacterium]